MSESYRSALRISFDVRGGLLVRQVHHWAALVFVGAIVLHLCRVFFTGAYRRPREINWVVGVTMLLLAILNGFTGYSLPDDLLSGTRLRIAHSILMSLPWFGTWLALLLFGGEFPGSDLSTRLFIVHVLLVPAALVGLLTVHLAILWRQKHTQFAGRGRREDNVVGSRLWPTYAVRSGLLMILAGALFALGGLAQINPVWLYGPYEPAAVSTAAQPDWYMGWIEGALRLMPPVRLCVVGYRVPEILFPAVIFPTLTFGALYLWPAIDKRLTRDRAEHHVLQRPRDHPMRTSFGMGVLGSYAVLFLAGGEDVLAQQLDVRIGVATAILQGMLVVVPLAVAFITYRLCRDLAADVPSEEFAQTGSDPIGESTLPAGDDSVPGTGG